MATTLISGGTVISAVGRREADVLVDGETIVALLAPGQAAAMGVQPDRTIDSLPRPRDVRVTLVEVPERRVAVLGYRGRYRGDVVEAHQRVLRQRVAEAGLPAKGEPSFAGFDPPWTIPLLRRNEVWIELV